MALSKHAIAHLSAVLTKDIDLPGWVSLKTSLPELIAAIESSAGGGAIVDPALSDTSTNPVTNQAITAAIENLQNQIDSAIPLDTELNPISTNGVENQAITEFITDILDTLASEFNLPDVIIQLPTNQNIMAFAAPGNIVDGETLVPSESIILLTGQTDPIQNGPWIFNGNGQPLTRPISYNPLVNQEVGQQVEVTGGSNAGVYELSTTTNADGKTAIVDTDGTQWFPATIIADNPPVALPVKMATTDINENIVSFQNSSTENASVLLNNGDRILLTAQTDPSENGIWIYNGINAVLLRPVDYNNDNIHYIGEEVMVYDGDYAEVQFRLSSTNNSDNYTVVIDTDETEWNPENMTASDPLTSSLWPVRIAVTDANENVSAYVSASTENTLITMLPGNRILLTSQTDPTENGIWQFNSYGNPLTRPTDYSERYNHIIGKEVIIYDGAYANEQFRLSKSNNSDNITVIVDTDETTWIQEGASSDSSSPSLATPAVLIPARIAITDASESVTSFGNISAENTAVTLNNGDRILLTVQTNPMENGIWIYNGAGSALSRPEDYDSNNNHIVGEEIMILDGDYAVEQFRLATTTNTDRHTVVVDTDYTTWNLELVSNSDGANMPPTEYNVFSQCVCVPGGPSSNLDFTANAHADGHVISADDETGGAAFQAVDGNTGTKWGTVDTAPEGILTLQLANPMVFDGVTLRGTPDSSINNWEIRGSNDGVAYTILHTSLIEIPAATSQSFEFRNTVPYRYYQFHADSTVGSGAFELSMIQYVDNPNCTGDGLVPCPSADDIANQRVLAADGTWVDSTQDDSHLNGVRVAVEDPVSIATYNGANLDGEVIATNDRILLLNQADPTENGIWVWDGTNLVRPDDYNSEDDARIGVRTTVEAGSNAGIDYKISSTTNADGETVSVDTDGTNWVASDAPPVIGLDPVDIAVMDVNENVMSYAGASTENASVTLISGTSRILLTEQTNPVENGVWIYNGNGAALTRPDDYTVGVENEIGLEVIVKDGDYKGDQFRLAESNNADLETVLVGTDQTIWYREADSNNLSQLLDEILHPINPVDIALSNNENIAGFAVDAAPNTKDGVVLVPGTSRILLTEQTNPVENGVWIYNGNGAALTRPDDYNDELNHSINEEVIVKDGSFKGSQFRLSESNNVNSETVVVDTDETVWYEEADSNNIHKLLDMLAPVDIALSINKDISAFPEDSSPNVVDGVTLIPGTSRILLTGQTDSSRNGIWIYQGNGAALTRPDDYNNSDNKIIRVKTIVKDGTHKGDEFMLSETDNPDLETVVVDTDETVWVQSTGLDVLVKVSANDNVANYLLESFDVTDAIDGSRIDGVNSMPIEIGTDTEEDAKLLQHSGIAITQVSDTGGSNNGREVVQVHLLNKTSASDDYTTDDTDGMKALPFRFWRGTRAEYNAITTLDPDTMYIIKD